MLSIVKKLVIISFVGVISTTDGISKTIVSNGEPIEIEEKGFNLTPPNGWSVNFNYPSTTLLLEAPDRKSDKYRRTIQVLSFSESRYMDELSSEEFALYISKNFSQASAMIQDFEMRDKVPVELNSNLSGYLYYTSFKIDETELMQMHVLISSATRHFLVTYTDLAVFFDTDISSEVHLNEAWQVMSSIELDSPAPVRFSSARNLVVVFSLALLFGVGYWIIRSRRAASTYRKYADESDVEYDTSNHGSKVKTGLSSGIYGTIQESSLYETAIESNMDEDYGDDEDEYKHAG